MNNTITICKSRVGMGMPSDVNGVLRDSVRMLILRGLRRGRDGRRRHLRGPIVVLHAVGQVWHPENGMDWQRLRQAILVNYCQAAVAKNAARKSAY